MNHYNLVHKFIPTPQAMKIPDAKAAVDKEWKKLETNPAWQLDKVKTLKRRERQEASSICYIDGHMSPQKRGVTTNITYTKAESCSEVTL